MELIYRPEVILVAQSCVDLSYDLRKYIEPRGDSDIGRDLDFIPEVAGRICYQSFVKPRPGGQKAYLDNILKGGHGSVLEHSSVSFVIKGVSRALTHELVRHRAGTAFSQISQRFCEPDEMGFIVPPLIIGDKDAISVFKDSCIQVRESYDRLHRECVRNISDEWLKQNPGCNATREDLTLIRKRGRESARALLPNCIETHLVMTGNLRAWRHIVELRGSIHADLEIRRLAVEIAKSLKSFAPNAFQDVQISADADHRESVVVQYSKV